MPYTLCRRVYWRYMRQLWDENYLELYDADMEDENKHREVRSDGATMLAATSQSSI